MSARRTPWVLLVAALLAVPALFAAPAQAAVPVPCNGMFLTDVTGDASYDSNSFLPGGEKPGTPNMDITGLFFNYAAGADGKPALTMNTQIAKLDKTVPPKTENGASGGVWYYGYYMVGDTTHFVRAANKTGDEIEYAYGEVVEGAFITAGDTTGSFNEGENGVVSVVIPEEAGAMAQETAPSPKTNAAKTCKALRTAAGEANFKAAYGTNKTKSNAFGKCVSKQAKVEEAEVAKAQNACKAEQADPNFAASHDGKTFDQFYGTNKNGKNAYGKCRSAKAKAAHEEETETKVKAAKTCKTELRTIGRDAFVAKYGGKANAFGKCISAEAKADKAARS